MRIRLYVDKVAALNAGKDKHGWAVVDFPAAELTAAQRAELAHHTAADTDHDFSLPQNAGQIPEATPAAVPALLDALAAGRAAAEAERRAGADRDAAKVRDWLALPDDAARQQHLWFSEGDPFCAYYPDLFRAFDDRKKELRRQQEARQAAESAERRRREDAAVAERKRLREEGEIKLRAWAAAHGSELLKARIAEGFEWVHLGRREFSLSVTAPLGAPADDPEGTECAEVKDRTTPTLEEIEALRAARKALDGKPAVAELVLVVYEEGADEGNDYCSGEKTERTELRVVVTCPDGDERELFFLPAAEAARA